MKSFRNLLSTLVLAAMFAGPAFATEKVNINTADAATLDKVLVNIGPAKAEAIVEHRRANGPFRSAEQLADVQGIGLRTVELNRDRIVVGGAAPATKGKATQTRAAPRASAQQR